MALLLYLADVFIDTFGITRPSPQGRRQAALFIFVLLLMTLGVVLAIFFALHARMK